MQVAAGADAETTRTARGACVGKCPEGFRDNRGGQALQTNAIASARFDQADYEQTRGYEAGGMCEGVVREAMRRVDRSTETNPPSLVTVANGMSTDATSRSGDRADMFSRIDRFQTNRNSLSFAQYTANPPRLFNDAHQTRDARIDSMLGALHDRLSPNDLAYIQLSLESTVGPNRQDYGHAIAVQRENDGLYAIFDPNNGAFEYQNWEHASQAFRQYMNSAYTDTQYRLAPFLAQIYSRRAQPGNAPAPALPARLGSAGIGPPEDASDYHFYHDSADRSNNLSIDGMLSRGWGREGIREPEETFGSYVLTRAAQNDAGLQAATRSIDDELHSPGRKRKTVSAMTALHDQYQSASVTDLRNRIRHSGSLDIQSANDLISELRTNFGGGYTSDMAAMGLENDMAVIDLSVGRPATSPGTSSDVPVSSHPILVQRLHPSNQFERDQYELYDSNHGAFHYANFERLAAAVHGIYDNGYSFDGGIHHATTTWYADTRVAHIGGGVTLAGNNPIGLSPAANVTLDEAARRTNATNDHEFALPQADIPPQPDFGRPSTESAMTHVEFKRSTNEQSNYKPWMLLRPSTITPADLEKQGGFSAGQTPLRDVNLQTHNFDVASHGRDIDSAGYLGTFATSRVALQRLALQSTSGYIYAVAPSPNMVDVNASLGEQNTLYPDEHEFAAMGRIFHTQIMGWWPVKDGHVGALSLNPAYRWNIFSFTDTAGAQPQLARFPMNSSAWKDESHKSFVTPVFRGSKEVGFALKQDPNIAQAEFYNDALMKLEHRAKDIESGKEYRGPMTIRAYGGDGTPYILYADRGDNVYVGRESSANAAGNTTKFVMGADGRFHYPKNYSKVLRVDSNGSLFVGSVYSRAGNTNGVFQIIGNHIMHLQDMRYLTVGKSWYTPFLTDYDAGSRSSWKFTDRSGARVLPSFSHLNTYSRGSFPGTPEQMYRFEQDPDTALPKGATNFVTEVPGSRLKGNWGKFEPNFLTFDLTDLRHSVQWLDQHRAALLFRDGFYATVVGPNHLEVRTLGGELVYDETLPTAETAGTYNGGYSNARGERIRDDVWQKIREREDARARLAASFAEPA